ncbi:hypothetical protein [Rhodococcus sp. X156]|uniref:hypothetical protein n=1 Tax=Rhodococcus sp. X156 TaxID=2499145 RepID=UPI000FDB5EA4|nr:hypothetical protein [Rhodococcus sp. X156]
MARRGYPPSSLPSVTDRGEHVRRRSGVAARFVLFIVLNLACTWFCVTLAAGIVTGLRADASVVGTFDDPGASCPGRASYVVDGVRYQLDTGGEGWCSRENGDLTSPQRVYYDSDDPEVAVFADPGGPTGVVIVQGVGLTLLATLTAWLWWAWWRWARVLLRTLPAVT